MRESVRIAGVQGFYGDSPLGAIQVVAAGAADFLVMDALAELTLSILQKDRMRDPSLGYARDIEWLAANLMPAAFTKGIRIVASSGGLNPGSAAEKVCNILKAKGLSGIKIGVVTGDDMLGRLDELQAGGERLNHLDTGAPFSTSSLPVTHANVYTGSASVAEALDQGAQLVLTGRVADPCLSLGILIHSFGWKEGDGLRQADLDLLASGIAVGHLLECGGQASGGNSYAEWPMPYRISDLGYPIAEVFPDGHALFSKVESAGGKMSRNTLREQLVYEIHDPAAYVTPDVVVDFSELQISGEPDGRVRVEGARGKPRPEKLKLAIGQMEGYMSDQFLFFSWPHAYEKARMFEKAAREIWAGLPFALDDIEIRFIGINGIHGDAAPMPDAAWLAEMNEIGVRLAFRHTDPKAGKKAIQSLYCLALNGPPGNVGVPGWGNIARAQLSLWPSLIDRKWVSSQLEILSI
jgi:hypothetical protein